MAAARVPLCRQGQGDAGVVMALRAAIMSALRWVTWKIISVYLNRGRDHEWLSTSLFVNSEPSEMGLHGNSLGLKRANDRDWLNSFWSLKEKKVVSVGGGTRSIYQGPSNRRKMPTPRFFNKIR